MARETPIPKWLPNALTSARIALLPAWLWLALLERARALEGESVRRWPIIALLLVIGVTDVIDGKLARAFGLTSNLGATLDAVADKLASVIAVTFLAFAGSPGFTPLPMWLWVALLGRDVLLAIGWVTVWMVHRTVTVEHRWHGRLATLVLFFVVVAACAAAPAAIVTFGSALVVALALPGTVAYVRAGFRQIDPPATLAGGPR